VRRLSQFDIIEFLVETGKVFIVFIIMYDKQFPHYRIFNILATRISQFDIIVNEFLVEIEKVFIIIY
jgi:hypothetical protein